MEPNAAAHESVTNRLAQFAIETDASILTLRLIAAAKLEFLDTIGIMVRGAQHPAAGAAIRLALHSGGYETLTSTPEQLAALLKQDIPRWAGVIRSAGITPE